MGGVPGSCKKNLFYRPFFNFCFPPHCILAPLNRYLACLENLTVIKLISRVIADFADGEVCHSCSCSTLPEVFSATPEFAISPALQVAQAGKLFDPSITMDDYLDKSFNKTGTLIAAACKSAAVFSEVAIIPQFSCLFCF